MRDEKFQLEVVTSVLDASSLFPLTDSQQPLVGPAKGLHRTKVKVAAPSTQRKNKDYPEHAQLKLPPNGQWKELALLEQPPLAKKVMRGAIEIATLNFFLVSAWPATSSRSDYGKPVIMEAVRSIQDQFPQVKDIRDRLECDDEYVQALANLVSFKVINSRDSFQRLILLPQLIDRLALLRSPARTAGGKTVPLYKLGLGEGCKARVSSLFTHHAYTFPGFWKRVDGVETNVCVHFLCSSWRTDPVATGMGSRHKGAIHQPSNS